MQPRLPIVCTLFLALVPAALSGQSARQIIDHAVQSHEARIADIEDYTIIEELNGAEQVAYYEKEVIDGRPVFVRRGAADVALARAGLSWGQLQGLLTGAFTRAGFQALTGELQGASPDQMATLMASMGQRLAGPDAGDLAAAARDALVDAGTDALKDALVGAAVDAGLQALATGIGGAAGAQVATLIQALRGSDGFADALGNLARALPGMAGAAIPGGTGGAPGMPGMNTLPGGVPGGPMGANLASDPRSLALSAAASAGLGMLVGAGARAIAGALSGDDEPDSADPYAVLRRLSDRFTLTGSETIDGHPVWVLAAEDAGGIDVGGEEFRPTSITVHLDRESEVIREVRMEGEADMDGSRGPMEVAVRLEDYRDVQGLLYPFRTVTTFRGPGEGMSAAEREEMSARMEEARRQMAEMEKQLAQLPPEQRRMVEQQLEQMGGASGLQERAGRQMEALAEGRMESVVGEVRVNQGPPEELTGGR